MAGPIIKPGSRKITVALFAIVGVVLMALIGDIDLGGAIKQVGLIASAFFAGSGLEHIGQGIGNRKPPV